MCYICLYSALQKKKSFNFYYHILLQKYTYNIYSTGIVLEPFVALFCSVHCRCLGWYGDAKQEKVLLRTKALERDVKVLCAFLRAVAFVAGMMKIVIIICFQNCKVFDRAKDGHSITFKKIFAGNTSNPNKNPNPNKSCK